MCHEAWDFINVWVRIQVCRPMLRKMLISSCFEERVIQFRLRWPQSNCWRAIVLLNRYSHYGHSSPFLLLLVASVSRFVLRVTRVRTSRAELFLWKTECRVSCISRSRMSRIGRRDSRFARMVVNNSAVTRDESVGTFVFVLRDTVFIQVSDPM